MKFTKADETCGSSSDPRKCNRCLPSDGYPVCPGGSTQATVDRWQTLPTPDGPEPAVLTSYINSEPTRSWNLILRQTLANRGCLKFILSPNLMHFQTYNYPTDNPLTVPSCLRCAHVPVWIPTLKHQLSVTTRGGFTGKITKKINPQGLF